MHNKKTPHISSSLNKSASLHSLMRHAHYLRQLDSIVHHQLNFSLQQHCKVANYRENTLYLHVDSPAWATKLRFTLPELLNNLRKYNEFRLLERIYLSQDNTRAGQQSPLPKPMERLSPESAMQIEYLAEHVSDNRLANALRRLAKRTG